MSVEDAGAAGARPSGRRFGILVHALLAAVPLDAGAQDIRDLAEIHARMLGSLDAERAAASTIVDCVLRHQVFAAARAALASGRACRREAPVSIALPTAAPSAAAPPAGEARPATGRPMSALAPPDLRRCGRP